MGTFVNPDNSAFQVALNSEIYVDKTGLIGYTNKVMNTLQGYICNSRPRRFGKSITANMLTAYYSKGCDSKEMFANLEIRKHPDFEKHLNRYDVIHLDVQWCMEPAGGPDQVISYITKKTIEELRAYYPDEVPEKANSLPEALSGINTATGRKFIIIIDEWDVLIRDEGSNRKIQDEYINFLRGMFKGTEPTKYIQLAYLTGILPIKKLKTQSALNNFDEYTMLDADIMAPYIGFTEEEVVSLCKKYDRDFEEVKRWYDGYILEKYQVYNPRAVVSLMLKGRFKSYWSDTGSYEAVIPLINKDFDGLKTALIEMLSGGMVRVNVRSFQNDTVSFASKDDVITYMIHLGYLAYDQASKSAFVPNEEIRQELTDAIESIPTSIRLPRIMIAAEKSGGGKTFFTCVLLSLLKERIEAVRAFKCGPDYIDPMFHRTVLEIPSRNLDTFFVGADTLRYLLGREVLENRELSESRIAVLEGVMGFYDGLGGVSERASAWEVADLTDTPVILIVDMKGRSLSALASIKGFMEYQERSHVAGVIFNRLSPMIYPGLKKKAEQELGIRVFGYIPELRDLTLESRHLGLVMPEEIPGLREKLELVKEKIRAGIDLDGILEAAEEAPELLIKIPEIIKKQEGKTISGAAAVHTVCHAVFDGSRAIFQGKRELEAPAADNKNSSSPVIAVARDEAFCFYYEDNLDLLKKLGARIRYFSPIRDQEIPPEASALYLGGGYPELHAKALSENKTMLSSIREAIRNGMPCIAECGGYLYLKESIEDPDGKRWEMTSVLPGNSQDTGKLGRFGYITVTAKKDGLLGPEGTQFRAHEFHHWDSPENGTDFQAKKPVGTRGWECGYTTESFYAGFPHLYFYSNPEIAEHFVKQAQSWREAIWEIQKE